MSVVIGVDMSLTSPGMCVLTDDSKWDLYAFHQQEKFRATSTFYQTGSVSITLLDTIPDAKSKDVVRYQHIVSQLCGIIAKLPGPRRLIMEGYAFGADSANAFKLMELGGIFKVACSTLVEEMIILPPTKWKRQATGFGKADKIQTLDFMKTHGPCLDFMQLFGSHAKVPPSPVSDLADACGLVLAFIRPLPQPVKKISKKQKIT